MKKKNRTKKRCYYVLFILSIILSCDSKDTKIEYYSSGAVKSEAEFEGIIQDGVQVEYYEHGTVKTKSLWEDGKQHGLATLYYPNGKIESTSEWKYGQLDGYYEHYYENGNRQEYGYYRSGVKDGPYKLFYEDGKVLQKGGYRDGIRHGEQRIYSEEGKLKSIKHFLNIKGEEMLAGFVLFNEDGTIREESIRIEIDAKKDTVVIGEPLEVNIQLKKPYFDSTSFVLGVEGFDEKFNVSNPSVFDTLWAEDHQVTINIEPKDKGEQYLRGYANNFKVTETSGDTVTTVSSHIYFEYPFFVKE